MIFKGLVISKNDLYCKLLALIAFFISIFFYPYYSSGDQEHYREFYTNVSTFPIAEAYALYFSSLGSLEPIYFLIVYYCSPFIEKDLIFSILNGLLFYLFSKFLVSFKVNKFVILSFILNFYILVLFFAAERLKVAVIVFLFAFMFVNKKRISILMLSVLAHLQMAITFALYLAKEMAPDFIRLIKGRLSYKIIGMFFVVLFLLILISPLYEQLLNKIIFYMGSSDGLFELLKPLIFYFITLLYAGKKKLELSLMSLVIFLATFFVGSDRLVMFSYFIFIYYAIPKKNGFDFIVVVVNVYFIYKSYYFISNILSCGEGFSCV